MRALDRAYAAIPETTRDAAFRAYQRIRGHGDADGDGVAASIACLDSCSRRTRRLLDIMNQTVTFPDRLKAGLSGGWTLAHKTGTSGTWRG